MAHAHAHARKAPCHCRKGLACSCAASLPDPAITTDPRAGLVSDPGLLVGAGAASYAVAAQGEAPEAAGGERNLLCVVASDADERRLRRACNGPSDGEPTTRQYPLSATIATEVKLFPRNPRRKSVTIQSLPGSSDVYITSGANPASSTSGLLFTAGASRLYTHTGEIHVAIPSGTATLAVEEEVYAD